MVTGLNSREPLTVLYDRDCGICTQVSRALVRLDHGARLRLVALQTASIPGAPPPESLAESLHAVDGAGNWFRGAEPSSRSAGACRALRPVALVARLPGAIVVLEIGYGLVADNRQRLSGVLGLKACRVPQSSSVIRDPKRPCQLPGRRRRRPFRPIAIHRC